MRWARIVAIVLGSVAFFPVSCTTGVVVGTHVVAALDKREVQKGDVIHSLFKVVAEPGEEGRPFRVLGKDKCPPYAPAYASRNPNPPISFRMSEPSGSVKLESSTFSYRVLEDNGEEQLIELVEAYDDGDNTIWSRYRATKSTVSPVSSRMAYFGYMFTAMWFAFVGALLILGTGRYLSRKIAPRTFSGER